VCITKIGDVAPEGVIRVSVYDDCRSCSLVSAPYLCKKTLREEVLGVKIVDTHEKRCEMSLIHGLQTTTDYRLVPVVDRQRHCPAGMRRDNAKFYIVPVHQLLSWAAKIDLHVDY
jgi:hypothetical protein